MIILVYKAYTLLRMLVVTAQTSEINCLHSTVG